MFVYTEQQYASLHLQEVQLSVDALTSNLRAAWQTQSFSLPCCFKVDHGVACWGQAGDAQEIIKKKEQRCKARALALSVGTHLAAPCSMVVWSCLCCWSVTVTRQITEHHHVLSSPAHRWGNETAEQAQGVFLKECWIKRSRVVCLLCCCPAACGQVYSLQSEAEVEVLLKRISDWLKSFQSPEKKGKLIPELLNDELFLFTI